MRRFFRILNRGLGIQITRSLRPEGVRWRPKAYWKAILMYFTKILKSGKKVFGKIFCDSRKIEVRKFRKYPPPTPILLQPRVVQMW